MFLLSGIQLTATEILGLVRIIPELDELDLTDTGMTGPVLDVIADALRSSSNERPKIRRIYIST